jgi:hypothetical protein
MQALYRMFQEEISIFREVTISVILSKKAYIYNCKDDKQDVTILAYLFIYS